MKKLLFIILVILFFLQFSVLPMVFPGLRLNILFALVVAMALVYPFKVTLPWALLAGILMDTFSVVGFGLYSVIFLCTAFFLDLACRNILPERKGVVVVGGVSVPIVIAFAGMVQLFSRIMVKFNLSVIQVSMLSQGKGAFIGQILLLPAVIILLYYCLDKMERSFGSGRLDLKLINH